MKEEKKKSHPAPYEDPRRVAYMLEWRDRSIEKLQEAVRGYEEERGLLGSLLFCALCKKAEVQGEERFAELRLDKAEVASLIGRWHCEVKDGGDAYVLRFSPRISRETGKECRDGSCPQA